MDSCSFCGKTNSSVRSAKLRGTNRFYICSSCQIIMNDALSKKGYEYDQELDRLESDFRVPRDLLNLLYIVPYYKKTKKNIKGVKVSRLSQYLDDNKTSKIKDSTVYTAVIFVSLSFVSLLLPYMGNFNWLVYLIYFLSSFLFSFLIGVLILNTGVTSVPVIRTKNCFIFVYNFMDSLFNKINSLESSSGFIRLLIFFFIKMPSSLLFLALFILWIALFITFIPFVAIVHALFLFGPAFYIDSKRRTY